jgi:hypothetical protein
MSFLLLLDTARELARDVYHLKAETITLTFERQQSISLLVPGEPCSVRGEIPMVATPEPRGPKFKNPGLVNEVYKVLACADRRMTGEAIIKATGRPRSSVMEALRQLQDSLLVDNDQDADPNGYGLVS